MKQLKKRLLAALLSLSMIASAFSSAGPIMNVSAATELVNVALEAHSATTGDDVSIEDVIDGSTDTVWEIADVSTVTGIVQLNMGRSISKLNLKFKGGEGTSSAVKVTVKYAQNGVTSDLITFGSGTYNLSGDGTVTMSVATPVSATHFYVELSVPDNSAAGTTLKLNVGEIEIFESQEVVLSNYNNIARQATITATGGNEHPTEGSANLVDGSKTSLYKFYNAAMSSEQTITLSYDEARSMDAMVIYFESFGETDSVGFNFNYSIKAKNSEGTYDTIASNVTANRTDNYTQTYKFAEKVYSEVQIVMHSCTTSSGYGWPAVAEFEVYGSQPEVTDEGNIAIGKPVHAASGKGRAVNITDGAKDSYWTGDYYPAYVDIDLEANYNLESVEVYTPTNGYSQYSIYTSMDGRNFEKLAEKTSTASATDAGEAYAVADHDEDKAREARIVRIFMEYNSAQAAPVLNEVRVIGTPSGTAKQERPEINVKKYSETEYAAKTITVADTYAEVNGIIERRLGEAYKAWFELEIAANPNGSDYDYFELSMVNGKVHVKGNDGVSLATGINHYLKYYCNVNISQVGDQVKMPASMPQITGTVHKETKAKVRYSYNYCTLSYSMAFWGEPEWRNELDWLALNGVNVVLDATAQEEVWRRFLGKLGYSHEDAKDYIAGPAYYAWAYMANLSGFGGPVHDSWFEDRTELARKNQHIMRTLGMQPALQGYSGMVPTDIKDYDSSAPIISQGKWCSFQRPAMLVTTDAKFDEYAELFYQCQEEVYGPVSDYYATDPFHEGGNTGGMAANAISREVLTSMLKADKDAIWIIQAWQGNPTTALLNGLDEVTTNSQGETIVGAEHALVLDLYAEKTPHNQETGGSYGDEKEFDATPWVFCMLNNFGGRLGLHGHLDNLANNIPAAMNRSSHMAGIGIAPEASVNNPVLYDFLFETIWQDDASQQVEVIDLNTWLDDYAERRYGAASESANKAWDILKDTVYKASLNNLGQGAPESVVNARPATSISAASTWGNAVVSYDKVKLEEAALLLLEDYDTLKSSEGYMYDVANVLQQVLSNSAQEYHKRMVAAYSAGEVESFKTLSAKFLEIIDYMELVTATSEYFLLGRWVEQAKALADSAVAAGDDFTVELYEINARALVTTWGSINQCESGGLKDYSNRQWAGLIGDFYKPRWERWITARTNELEGNSYESSINWFQWEWAWVRENEEFTTTATPQDLETLGKEIIEKFTSTDPNADDSRDVDVNKITVTDGNHETSSTTEGAASSFVQDGQSGTMWHTEWDGSTDRSGHYITFTFDEPTTIDGMRFLQRQSGKNGVVTKFDLYVKTADSGDEWVLLVDDGALTSDRSWQIVNLPETKVTAVKFQVVEAMSDNAKIFAAAAEIRFTQPVEGEEPELNKETVKVEAGDTIVIEKKGNAPLTADMVELDTDKAKVTVTNTYVQDATANTYLSTDKTYTNTPIWLSKCLHTFTLKADGIYEITGIAEDGETTVYVNPRVPGRVGYPHTEEAESIQVIPQTGGGYKLIDNSQQDYWLTYKSAWNVFNEDEKNASDATTVFHLYKQVVTVDENGNTIYTYEKANDLGTAAASANARTAAADNQYLIVAELANGDNYVLRPSNDTSTADNGIGRNSHVVKMSDGTLKEYTSTIEIEGVTPGTTTYVTVGDTKYEIQVTGEVPTEEPTPEPTEIPVQTPTVTKGVTVKVGETITLTDTSGLYAPKAMEAVDTTKATVTVVPGSLTDIAAYTYNSSDKTYTNTPINLKDCLYTFKLNTDGTYTISGIAEDGTTTVYMNPRSGTGQFEMGYPNTETPEKISVVAKDGGFQFVDQNTDGMGADYSLVYWYQWNVFNENKASEAQATTVFKLYECVETTDANGNTVRTYQAVNEIQDGGQYVVVAEFTKNGQPGKAALRPSNAHNNVDQATERNQHIVSFGDETQTSYHNKISVEGVSEGTTSIIVGTTQYNITVTGTQEADITVKVGQTVRIFDQSGTFDASELDKVNTGVAQAVVTPMTMNELTANLRKNNSDLAGETISLSECLYAFNMNADGSYTIVGTTEDGQTVYVNPYTTNQVGYPNSVNPEGIIVTKDPNGTNTFKLTDATDDQYCLTYRGSWGVFNEQELDGANSIQYFKLYELKETAAGSGIYEYSEVSEPQNGGQYVIAAVYGGNEFVLRPCAKVNNANDATERNEHVARKTATASAVSGNEMLISGVTVGDTDLTVGNTIYHIHVVAAEQVLTMLEGEKLVISGSEKSGTPDANVISAEKTADDTGFEITALDMGKTSVTIDDITYHITVKEAPKEDRYLEMKVGDVQIIPGTEKSGKPDVDVISVEKTDEGFKITALDGGETIVEIDNFRYHITVKETQVASAIGTSRGQEVTKLTMSANNTFDLDMINLESGTVTWKVVDADGKTVSWAAISEAGVISATTPDEHEKTYEGFIVATVTDGDSTVEYKTALKLTPAPTATSTRLYDIYIGEIYHTEVYYGCLYGYDAEGGKDYAYTTLEKVQEGELLYISMGSAYHNAVDLFAKPDEGYALTQMGATGSAGHYMRLEGETPEETEFISKSPVAGYVQYHDIDQEATVGLVQQAMNLECHGAQGFTRKENTDNVSTTLDYRSEKLPTVKKSVYGIGTGENYRDYTEGVKAEIGEYVYFKVDVQTYPVTGEYLDKNNQPLSDKEIVKYTDIQLIDDMIAAKDAVFIPFENIGDADPIGENKLSTLDITQDILDETEVGQLHEYYVAYQIQPEDVVNIDLKLSNTVKLSYEYETYYSSGSYGGDALDDAEILITTLLLDNLVVDFGLPVVYEFETTYAFNSGEVTTNYGTANIVSTKVDGKEIYSNTVTYAPSRMLQGMDAIPLVATETGDTHMIAVYPASTVYYEEGFAAYTEKDGVSQWGDNISFGNGVQETQIIPKAGNNANAEENPTATVHYGFDGKYAAEAAGPSNGTEAVSTTAGNAASFTFTGTAADVYANCQGKDDPTGTISVLVKNEEGGIEKLLIVNTQVAGDADAASSVQNDIEKAWNLPVAALDMEEHGTYSVSIRHTRTQNETAENMNPVRLDGFRVYNTLTDQSAYAVHNEENPIFVEMRNEVLGAVNLSEVLPTPTVDAEGNKVYPDDASIYAENIAGGLSQIYGEQAADGTGKAYIVMNDAKTSDQIDAASAKDLLDNGPKNELFLYPGESLVFGLEDGLENVQIGMKAVNGALTKENADAVLIEKAVEKTTKKDISGEPLELRLLYYTDPAETTAWDPLLGTMTDEQAQTIKAFTENLVAGAATDYEKARKIYEWVNTNVTYASADNVTPYLNPYDVFTNKTAVCGGYSNLYKAMLNSVGIPSVLISGDTNYGAHIWNAVYADGRWFHSDSTWEGNFDKGTEAFKQEHHTLFRVENVKLEGDNGVYIGYDHGIAAVGVKDATGTVNVPAEFEGMTVTSVSYQLLNAQYGVKVLNVGKNISYIETQSISAQMEAIHVDAENPYFESVDGVLFNNDKTQLLVYPAGMKAESFTLPAETVTFDEKTAFSNTALKNISVEEGNTKYSSYDGALYNKDQTELVMVPAGKTTIEILESATIGSAAFANVDTSKLTIYCYANSPAHQYAVTNNINYVLIGVTATPTPEPTPISPEGMSVYMSGIFELSGSTSFTTTTMDDIKAAVFDDNTGTFWNSNWVNSGSNIASGNPYFMVDLGTVYKLSQVDYTPRYHSASEYWECTGNIKTLIIEVSTDGHTWTAVTGENGLDISTKIKKEADTTRFPEKVTFTEQEARYVRIGGSASFGVGDRANRSITIGELDIYGTPIAKKLATDNMAVEVSGTKELSNATAASATPEQIKTNIFDGNNATFWNSDWVSSGISKGNPYITLDLGATYQINQVDYTPRYDGGVKWHCTGNIKKLLLEVSIDGEEWTMVTADTGMDLTEKIDSTDANAFPVDIEFTMQEARYIRISGLECYGHDNNTINTSITVGELAVYGIPVAKKLPVNQMAITASGTYELTGKGENKDTNTYVATGEEVRAKIFDGAKTTFWNSDWVDSGALAVGNPYLTIDLGTNYKVSQVDYTPRFDSSAKWNCTGCIKTLVVEVSTDNVTWTKVTGENGLDIASKITSGDETLFPLAITFAEREVRYVRISGLSSTGNRSITVGELGIYGIPVIATVVPTETTDTTPVAATFAEAPAESTVVSKEQMNLASLSTSTDMFYVLGDTEASTDAVDVKTTITITNNSDKVLSITKLKYFTTDEANSSAFRTLDVNAFTAALTGMGFDTEAEKHPEEERKPVTEIFSDVYEDWYTEYVQYMYDNGIMSGIAGTDQFAPADAVTKAQVAQVLYNMEGKPELTDRSACTELKDVYEDWYTDAVCWAYSAGVVTGDLNTKEFQPNANITREQFALMLYRYAEYKGYPTDATSTFENLLNADQVSNWAEAGMKWAVGTGLISGAETEAGLDLAPQGMANRAQMAAILTRFCETVK